MNKKNFKEHVRSEYDKQTKAVLIAYLQSEGLEPSGKEKKDELLDAIVELKVAQEEAREAREKEKKENESKKATEKKEPEKQNNRPSRSTQRRGRPSKIRTLPEDIELTESLNNPSVILTGEHIYSIEDKRNRYKKKQNPVTGELIDGYEIAAVIQYGSRLIYIPAEEYLESYYEMNQKNVGTYIEERSFAEVDFRITDVDRTNPENPIYKGSRVEALKKNRRDYWYSGRETSKQLMTPGTVKEARVVAVAQSRVYVELYGVEAKLGGRDVSYTYIPDMRTEYAAGDRVEVMIKSATLADDARAENLGYPVACELSIKEVGPDPRDKYFQEDLSDIPFRGVIRNINIDKNNITWYYVEMGSGRNDHDPYREKGMTIMCRLGPKITKIPRPGDIASGRITRPDKKNKFLYGTIYHLDPPLKRNRISR